MQHMKTVQIPATEKQIVSKVTCDLCGEEIKTKNYVVDEVQISYKTGSSYPEFSLGTETKVDMCGQCFNTKLIPWFRSIGVEPLEKDWVY